MIKVKTANKYKLPLILSICLPCLLLMSYFFLPGVRQFFVEAWEVLSSNDESRIRSWVKDFGLLGPLVFIGTMIAQMFLLVIPSILLMVVAILAYGPYWGSLLILIAIFAASSAGYALGHSLGEVRIRRLLGQKSEKKISVFMEQYGIWAVIITRLNPFLSNDAISFVAGLLRMGYWKFTAATLVGITPLTLYLAVMGKSTSQMKQGLFWGSGICLLGFIIYVWWKKRKPGRGGRGL